MNTVFFDIGNVLCFFSPKKILQNLSDLYQIDIEQVANILSTTDLQKSYEQGKISILEAHLLFQKYTPIKCNLDDFNTAISDIFTPNMEVWPIVKKLKENGHRLILLSNTCSSHFQWLSSHYSIFRLFHDQVLSFEVGYMKPDFRIFQKALEKVQKGKKNFYTDDIPSFVQSARNSGLDSEIFINAEILTNQLKQRNYI